MLFSLSVRFARGRAENLLGLDQDLGLRRQRSLKRKKRPRAACSGLPGKMKDVKYSKRGTFKVCDSD
jgi:hypothetical protein